MNNQPFSIMEKEYLYLDHKAWTPMDFYGPGSGSHGLVPSWCVIFDLEPLSLSFDFVFSSKIFKSFPSCGDESDSAGMRSLHHHQYLHLYVQFMRTSLTGFPPQSVRSSNANALDSPYLLVLVIRTSQSRQHDKSESDKSRKSPTVVLFDVDTRRISIVIVNTKEYHSDILAKSQG
ncbi:hypothetical protein Tco_1004976 [Tanacetum coccineum]|uniref:Uncharacterized protein n=1 Tax=Tanacetum coccineum TaxID=301880 RepID=A0ABQ5FEU1_9ASTR